MPRTWQPLVDGARAAVPLPGLVVRGEGRSAVLEHTPTSRTLFGAPTVAELCFWARRLHAVDWTRADAGAGVGRVAWPWEQPITLGDEATDLVADMLDELVGEDELQVVPGGTVPRTWTAGTTATGAPRIEDFRAPGVLRIVGRRVMTIAPPTPDYQRPDAPVRWPAAQLFALVYKLAPTFARKGYRTPSPGRPTPTAPPGLEPCVWQAGGRAGLVWLEGTRPADADGRELSAVPWAKADHGAEPGGDVAAALMLAERRLAADCPVAEWTGSAAFADLRAYEAADLWPGRRLRHLCRAVNADRLGITGGEIENPKLRALVREAKRGELVVVGASALGRPTIEHLTRAWYAVAKGSDNYVRGWRPTVDLAPLDPAVVRAGLCTVSVRKGRPPNSRAVLERSADPGLVAWLKAWQELRPALVADLEELTRAERRVSWVDPAPLLALMPRADTWTVGDDGREAFKTALEKVNPPGYGRAAALVARGMHPADAWVWLVLAMLEDVLKELGEHNDGALVVVPPPLDWIAGALHALGSWDAPALRLELEARQ